RRSANWRSSQDLDRVAASDTSNNSVCCHTKVGGGRSRSTPPVRAVAKEGFALEGQYHVVSLLLAESVHAGKECHGLPRQGDDRPGAARTCPCPGRTLSHPAPRRDLESHLQRSEDGPRGSSIWRRMLAC